MLMFQTGRILWLHFRNKLITQWEYKTNILAFIAITIAWIFVQIIFLKVIFGFAPSIAGWAFNDMVIYLIVVDISVNFWFFLGLHFDYDVVSGKLVTFLTKPVNEFLFYIGFDVSLFVFLISDIALLIGFALIQNIGLSFTNTLLAIIFFAISFPIVLLPILIIKSLSFWYGFISGIEQIYRALLFPFDRFPVTVLNKFFFFIFLVVTPAGYFHWYFSTAILLGKIPFGLMLENAGVVLLIDLGLYLLFRFIYKRGLRRYEGFGG